MKPTLLLSALLALAAGCCAGCALGLRTAGDELNQYEANGTKIRGPRVGLANALHVTLFSFDKNLKSSSEEPSIASVQSLGSKTAVQDLSATVRSVRGTNFVKTTGYGAQGVATDVSTNLPPTVEAGGRAGGQLLNKAVTGQ